MMQLVLLSLTLVTPSLGVALTTEQSSRLSAQAATPSVEVFFEEVGAALMSESPSVRLRAMMALSKFLVDADCAHAQASDDWRGLRSLIPALRHTLNDEHAGQRMSAVLALVCAGRTSSVDVGEDLIARFPDETNALVRGAIVDGLGRIGRETVEVERLLSIALQDPSTSVRRGAALVVMRLKPLSLLPHLAQALGANDFDVRADLVAALASYGAAARPYVPLLERVLASERSQSHQRLIRSAIATITQ